MFDISNTDEWLRPEPNYPTYPPYHVGLYLEEYFIDFYKKSNFDGDREFIPISWTSYYNNGCDRKRLQHYLSSLDSSKKYFIVCQHDDAPLEDLPPDTLVFSAGGNSNKGTIIPIPLVCSSIVEKIQPKEKDIFCSFIGSDTHEIRREIQKYSNNPEYYFQMDAWNNIIEEDKLKRFIDITSRSKFTLCPRGYGKTSFRLYEAMQLGSVPVYVSDEHYLPWNNQLEWNDICILIKSEEIQNLDRIIKEISTNKYNEILSNIEKTYKEYFTLDGICNKIIESVECYVKLTKEII